MSINKLAGCALFAIHFKRVFGARKSSYGKICREFSWPFRLANQVQTL